MKRASGVKTSPLKDARPSPPRGPTSSLELEGVLNLADFPLFGPLVLGASAVMEYQDGAKDYWALAHTGEKPDFHLRSSFTAGI
jgi:hypothetical protein